MIKVTLVIFNLSREKILVKEDPDTNLLWIPQYSDDNQTTLDELIMDTMYPFRNFRRERCIYISDQSTNDGDALTLGFTIRLLDYKKGPEGLSPYNLIWVNPREVLDNKSLSPLSRKVIAAELSGHTYYFDLVKDEDENESNWNSPDINSRPLGID